MLINVNSTMLSLALAAALISGAALSSAANAKSCDVDSGGHLCEKSGHSCTTDNNQKGVCKQYGSKPCACIPQKNPKQTLLGTPRLRSGEAGLQLERRPQLQKRAVTPTINGTLQRRLNQ